MEFFKLSEEARKNVARLANDMNDMVGAQKVILNDVIKNKSKAELKALAYDKFMSAAEKGDINMKIAAITLSAVYHAEMSIQNNKIAKQEGSNE